MRVMLLLAKVHQFLDARLLSEISLVRSAICAVNVCTCCLLALREAVEVITRPSCSWMKALRSVSSSADHLEYCSQFDLSSVDWALKSISICFRTPMTSSIPVPVPASADERDLRE